MPTEWLAVLNPSETRPVVAIIQARMGSKRLPGKVLMDIHGAPMLLRVAIRARRAHMLDRLSVATTDLACDDPVAEMCAEHRIGCFRGSATDVLDRFYRAAIAFQAAVVVRLTGDCPLIDPAVIDQTVRSFLGSDRAFIPGGQGGLCRQSTAGRTHLPHRAGHRSVQHGSAGNGLA